MHEPGHFADRAARHFAALRRRDRAGSDPKPPFPDGWFDLDAGLYADFGAMFYLAALVPFHAGRSLAAATSTFEPALRLGQYHIFRSDGFPRAFVSWAGLSPEVERRLALKRTPLRAEEWNGGPSVWLIDDGQKVRRDAVDTPWEQGADNPVWSPGEPLRLIALRDEVVAFQVVVEADGSPLDNVTVDFAGLTGPDGARIENAPGADDPTRSVGRRIERFVAHFVDIRRPSASRFSSPA